jgi:hypothetical protein
MNDEARMTKSTGAAPSSFGHSSFFHRSSFCNSSFSHGFAQKKSAASTKPAADFAAKR